MTPGMGVTIDEWRGQGPRLDAELDMLAEVLHAVVHDGASVSFVVPFSHDDARRFSEAAIAAIQLIAGMSP